MKLNFASLIMSFIIFVSVETSNAQINSSESELGKLLTTYTDAMQGNDSITLSNILKDDFTEVSFTGTVVSKTKFIEATPSRKFKTVSADEINIQSYDNFALITSRVTLTSTNPQAPVMPVRLTLFCSKTGREWKIVKAQSTLIRITTTPNFSTFDILPVPDNIRNFNWIKLMDDNKDDGRINESADGKSFAYFFDKATDMVWFKFDLYNQINPYAAAISVSLDTDADQSNGTNWYGKNSKFKLEKMLSVGPSKKQGTQYLGYNGITDEKGVQAQNWINVKSGNLIFYFDTQSNSYFLGVKRPDIDPNLHKFNVIGSVGQNTTWNDDIGEHGFATIELNL